MEFVDALIQKTDYLKQLELLRELETERIYCHHDLPHLLDTARIVWIRCLEEQIHQEKEQVYLAALLHDLGRIDQYQRGVPHEEASARRAQKLLEQIGYPREKRQMILDAVLKHRGTVSELETFTFSSLLQQADHQSRNCFLCEARESCNWPEVKKNVTVKD